jgi:hypothetical protein
MFLAEQDSAMMVSGIDMNPSRWSISPVLVVLDLSKMTSPFHFISTSYISHELTNYFIVYPPRQKEERRKKNMFRGMYIVY